MRHAARVPKKAPPRARGPRHNLLQGTPDVSAFPGTAWLTFAQVLALIFAINTWNRIALSTRKVAGTDER